MRNILCIVAFFTITLLSCNKNTNTTGSTTTSGNWIKTGFTATNSTSVFSMLVSAKGRIIVGLETQFGNNSLYTSIDTGSTWNLSVTNSIDNINGNVNSIKQDPFTSVILVGCISLDLPGLFFSKDDGATWTNNPNTFSPADFAFMNQKTYLIAYNGVSPSPGQYLLSSTDDFSSNLVDCDPIPPIIDWYRLFSDNGTLFLAELSSGSLYSSNNPEGRQFTLTDSGISFPNRGISHVTRLSREGNYLFVGTTDGVYRSSDEGQSWTACNLGFSEGANDFAVVGSEIYVALTDSAVYKSGDNGNTWQAYNQGLPSPLTVNCLQVDGNYLLEGDIQSTVYKRNLTN
jgi:hypothetical protein